MDDLLYSCSTLSFKVFMADLLPLQSERIILRRLSPSDLAAFQAYRHDPDVGLYQGWTPQTDAEALAFIHEMASALPFLPGNWLQFGIADRQTNLLIGDVGLFVAADGQSAGIGFTLCAQAQGRGLGSEAVSLAVKLLFQNTSVACIEGITDARNFASIKLLERIGMRRMATLSAVFNNEPCLEHTYAISRSDCD
jgi:ribosomal-protein-alanine N-acetyltransferase